MKRPSLILVFACVASVTAMAQTEQWINYLDENLYDTAEVAVSEVGAAMANWLEARTAHTGLLQSLYVEARREGWTTEEYESRLDAEDRALIAAGESEALSAIRSGLDVLRDVVREQPPPPLSRFASDANRWLMQIAAALAVQTAEVTALVDQIQEAGQGVDDSSARAFGARIGLPLPVEFEDASPQDQLFQLADDWLLVFMCSSGDDERSAALAALATATRSVSADLASAASELSEAFNRQGARVRRLRQAATQSFAVVRADSIATLTVSTAGEPDEFLAADDVSNARAVSSMNRLLSEIGESTRGDLYGAASLDATTRFALETIGRLLSILSDRQTLQLELNLGLEPSVARLTAGRLHRLSLDLVQDDWRAAKGRAHDAADRYRRSAEYDTDSNLLAAHRADARVFLESLEPWVTGRQARTGDAYKWALLSLVSNRYAQHLMLTDPELAEHQRLIGEFISSLYAGMLRGLPDVHLERLWRDSAPDAADSFDRTYMLTVEEDARVTVGPVYHAFVVEAQGEGFISENFARTSAAERMLATEWAHIHGLHVYVAPAEEPVQRLRGAVLPWFTLALGEQNEVQGFAHAIRGVFNLASTIEYMIQPALNDAGHPALFLYDPRLAEARVYLREARMFNTPPGETIAALFGIFPEANDLGGLTDQIERSVASLEARLSDIDAPDRRAILFAAGGMR